MYSTEKQNPNDSIKQLVKRLKTPAPTRLCIRI